MAGGVDGAGLDWAVGGGFGDFGGEGFGGGMSAVGNGELADAGFGQGEGDGSPGAAGTDHEDGIAGGFDAVGPGAVDQADAIEHIAGEGAVSFETDGIDGAGELTAGAELVAEFRHGRFVRDGDDQAVEILDAGELWDQGVDIIGLDLEGDEEGVAAFGFDHRVEEFRRADMGDRVGDDGIDVRVT